MGFTDNLKRSLGFEERESPDGKDNDEPTFSSMFHDLTENIKNGVSNLQNSARDYSQNSGSAQDYEPNVNHNQDNYHNYNPTQEPMPTSAPIFNDADDYVIVPEQSYYEIALIRPKSIDDVNYVVDQVIEEKNPVILDLSFLEKESPANFRLAGDKIKKMRERYGAQALLLARSEEKNLIIVSPNKVKLVNKNK